MADQDFRINIRTIADTTGIQLTRQQLTALQTAARQGNAEAISALNKLKGAASDASVGFGGLATGFGTMIALATSGVNKWRAFNDELDRSVDLAIKAEAKMRELGEAIIETQDKMISQRRTATEPLADSYVRLQQELISLQTQQSLLDLPTQAEEWNKLQKQIQDVSNELKGVTDKLGGAPPAPTVPFPKAKKGESQALVDEIERNRRAAEEASKQDVWEFDPETGGMRRTGQKTFPVFQPPPPPPQSAPDGSNQYPSPIGPPIAKGGGLGALTVDMLTEAFRRAMADYWSR